MDVNALDNLHRQARGAGLTDQRLDFIRRPDIADRHIIKCAHDAFYARDLAKMLQRDFVFLGAKPAHCHLHNLFTLPVGVMVGEIYHTSI